MWQHVSTDPAVSSPTGQKRFYVFTSETYRNLSEDYIFIPPWFSHQSPVTCVLMEGLVNYRLCNSLPLPCRFIVFVFLNKLTLLLSLSERTLAADVITVKHFIITSASFHNMTRHRPTHTHIRCLMAQNILIQGAATILWGNQLKKNRGGVSIKTIYIKYLQHVSNSLRFSKYDKKMFIFQLNLPLKPPQCKCHLS